MSKSNSEELLDWLHSEDRSLLLNEIDIITKTSGFNNASYDCPDEYDCEESGLGFDSLLSDTVFQSAFLEVDEPPVSPSRLSDSGLSSSSSTQSNISPSSSNLLSSTHLPLEADVTPEFNELETRSKPIFNLITTPQSSLPDDNLVTDFQSISGPDRSISKVSTNSKPSLSTTSSSFSANTVAVSSDSSSSSYAANISPLTKLVTVNQNQLFTIQPGTIIITQDGKQFRMASQQPTQHQVVSVAQKRSSPLPPPSGKLPIPPSKSIRITSPGEVKTTVNIVDSRLVNGTGAGGGVGVRNEVVMDTNKYDDEEMIQKMNDQIPSIGRLMITEEEQKTYLLEGLPMPTRMPLTRQEEKNLRRVRRKIKNKLSAKESRRRRKDYMGYLETRVENYEKENKSLKDKLDVLEDSNQSLLTQLQKLQQVISKIPEASKAQTSTCLMVLVLTFAMFVGVWYPSVSHHEAVGVSGKYDFSLTAADSSARLNPGGDTGGYHHTAGASSSDNPAASSSAVGAYGNTDQYSTRKSRSSRVLLSVGQQISHRSHSIEDKEASNHQFYSHNTKTDSESETETALDWNLDLDLHRLDLATKQGENIHISATEGKVTNLTTTVNVS